MYKQLPLPLSLYQALNYTILPALDELGSKRYDSPEARVMLMAIGLQESRFRHRRQVKGPARGLWQFERGGGVIGVLKHASTEDAAVILCKKHSVSTIASDVYAKLEYDDVLAAGFARLLLWTDPRRLPALGDADGAWDYYIRNWRPGKPHRQSWHALYNDALQAVAK